MDKSAAPDVKTTTKKGRPARECGEPSDLGEAGGDRQGKIAKQGH
jgi:hypothetical protein